MLAFEEKASKALEEFSANTIGPETLYPLKQRGLIRLEWEPYKRRSRFEFKALEWPIYRVFISPEGRPASGGRVHVTYDTSYPFTNLLAGMNYNIQVDVEQNGAVVLPERLVQAVSVIESVKWFVAPRAEGGNGKNPGSYNRPVDVSFANANAGPGDVVVLKSGIYTSTAEEGSKDKQDRGLHPEKSGTPGAHILFLAESNDVGSKRYVSFQTAWGNINVNRTDYVLFDGINCDSDQGRNSKALSSILGEYGARPKGVIVRNIYYRAQTSDKQIMVNTSREVLIENCFFPGSGESHNAYLCNNTYNRPDYGDSRIIFRNCISMNSTRNNVHANGFFDNFIIENNIFLGAKVANISLATVHRNSHVRNNIAYSGAKQAMTLNFYQENPGVPLEDREPSSNIHICHNTFVVPETTRYGFSDILVSDSRRLPFRHTIQGLYVKNNILVNLKESGESNNINLLQSRHLNRMEVLGNFYYLKMDHGSVRLPVASASGQAFYPMEAFEAYGRDDIALDCMDTFQDEKGHKNYEKISIRVGPWSDNRKVESPSRLFRDMENRDFRLAEGSPAAGGGVADMDTVRIVRDIYGNPRNQVKGKVDSGAVAVSAKREETTLLSEYQLYPDGNSPPKVLLIGQRTLVASTQIRVRSPFETSLRNFQVDFVLEKKKEKGVVDIDQGFIAEIELEGRKERLAFYRKDSPEHGIFWASGHVKNMNVNARGGEIIRAKVYVLLRNEGIVERMSTVIAHDNIWGFDARGRKVAVTGFNELRFAQTVRRAE